MNITNNKEKNKQWGCTKSKPSWNVREEKISASTKTIPRLWKPNFKGDENPQKTDHILTCWRIKK